MLLAQSHASILLSTAIVLFFTTALFLSGFAIQHRTLRDLRAAIKPQPHPSPKIVLPDRFRARTTELADGTVMVLEESEAQRDAREIEAFLRGGGGDGDRAKDGRRHVDVSPAAVVEEVQMMMTTAAGAASDQDSGSGSGSERAMGAYRPDDDDDGAARAMRDQENPDPAAADQKPISRAERRRLIKEELHRLAQDGTKVRYQRRLW